MYLLRVLLPLIATTPLALLPAHAQPDETEPEAPPPAVIQALEAQGVSNIQEFDAGQGVRGFAGVAGEQPVAIYVLPDGHAIAGTRLDSKGDILDKETVDSLVAKPMSDRAWAALETAPWVLDGQADAPRIIYTFTDPNCPYCHLFWEASRPWVEAGKVQLRHFLVGMLKEDSPAKAAAILGSTDTSAALQQHELSFDKGGITPAEAITDDIQEILEENQLLMMGMGFRGTPGIVVLNEEGVIQKYNGMPKDDVLGDVFGPR